MLSIIQSAPKIAAIVAKIICKHKIYIIALFISFSKLENLYFAPVLFCITLVSWPLKMQIP
jgi:hypothetical protein